MQLQLSILAHLQSGKRLNGNVRKGEHGTQIVFYKQFATVRRLTMSRQREEDRRAPFVLTYHTVFNVEQCDGLTLPQIEQPTQPNEVEVDETCEAIVSGWSNRPRSPFDQPNRIPRLLSAVYRFRTHAGSFSFRRCPALLQHPLS